MTRQSVIEAAQAQNWDSLGRGDAQRLFGIIGDKRRGTEEISDLWDEHIDRDLSSVEDTDDASDYWTGFWQRIEELVEVDGGEFAQRRGVHRQGSIAQLVFINKGLDRLKSNLPERTETLTFIDHQRVSGWVEGWIMSGLVIEAIQVRRSTPIADNPDFLSWAKSGIEMFSTISELAITRDQPAVLESQWSNDARNLIIDVLEAAGFTPGDPRLASKPRGGSAQDGPIRPREINNLLENLNDQNLIRITA